MAHSTKKENRSNKCEPTVKETIGKLFRVLFNGRSAPGGLVALAAPSVRVWNNRMNS